MCCTYIYLVVIIIMKFGVVLLIISRAYKLSLLVKPNRYRPHAQCYYCTLLFILLS